MAGNFAIQAAINSFTLIAYANAMKQLRENSIPVKPGPHIHDSVNFTVPKSLWREAVRIIISAMSEIPFETEVPFPASCEIGDRWGGMTTVHDRGKWIVPDEEERKNVPEWILRGFPELRGENDYIIPETLIEDIDDSADVDVVKDEGSDYDDD